MDETISRTNRLVGGLLTFCVLISACSSAPKSTPEDEIRALIAKGEKAAEEKDIDTLKNLISDSYKDEDGNRKPEIMKILAYHLLRNTSVYLLTRVRTIEFPDPNTAKVTVYVGMAGGKLGSVDDLTRLRADLYRVDFSAAREGQPDWRVTSAKWRPADMSDFDS